MGDDAAERQLTVSNRVRPLAWGGAAIVVLLPLLALKLAVPAAWEAGDLIFALFAIGGIGFAFELAVRTNAAWSFRVGALVGFGTALLLLWGNLAVGFVGSEDNPINIIYFAMPAIAIAGALVSGFRATGLAFTMAAAGSAQIAAGIFALVDDVFTGPLTAVFASMWLASAWLFRRSARKTAPSKAAA